MTAPRTIAYLATSVDGFLAGPQDELDWLTEPRTSPLPLAADEWAARASEGLDFDDFLARVGCLLMGRRTYDVVAGFAGPWPYGDVPVRVATTRPLGDRHGSTVTAVKGDIATLIADARTVAAGRNVYVDGGAMVRATLAAGLLDDLVVTMLPILLGEGISLFDPAALGTAALGTAALDTLVPRTDLTVVNVAKYGDGFIQIHYRCR